MKRVSVRVYGPLNDFVSMARRQATSTCTLDGTTSVKDLLEGLGVPHPEIELLLVNDEPAAFDRLVADGDRIAAFPRFHALDVSDLSRVIPAAADPIRFVADGHLGKLVRLLRLLGFDTDYASDRDDSTLAEIAARDDRMLLTRDRDLLKRRTVTRGYFVRTTQPEEQIAEVLRHIGHVPTAPYSRCLRCNATLHAVEKSAVADGLPRRTRGAFNRFEQCAGCGRVYWRGSHWARLTQIVNGAVARAFGSAAGAALSGATRRESVRDRGRAR